MFRYDLVDAIVRRIVDGFNPERVILFGSVARGDADEHSDVDLLVVVDTDADPFRLTAKMYRELADIRVPKDIIVVTPAEFEADRDNPLVFTSEIVRTGTVVYGAGAPVGSERASDAVDGDHDRGSA